MTDIVEKLTIWPAADGADALAGHFVEALMQEAAAEITKLRAERDAAARDMRERCAKVAEEMSENPNWSPSEQDGAFSLAKMLRLLPDTPAILATDGKDET
ncbi:hypothetical protein RPMA_12605 [Tardiphaga alba]|uniref:Uncharacterized protein n=1 Tax=Tardiphaga alba TaxID=340268 RepID=A0ABX8A775_9BRAD|nr:hypothetical protein [Tardiphaga alba]QUS39584.1 hypothetical protein RPMA_12605 [Tardiphaga alba]